MTGGNTTSAAVRRLPVVGVHGVGNHRADLLVDKAAAWLTAVWRRHLLDNGGAGLDSVDLTVVYYADLLTAADAQGAQLGLEAVLAADPQLEQMVLTWAGLLGAPEEIAQGWVTFPVRQAISWVAEHYRLDPKLVEWFVERFFPEVATYFGDVAARTAARDRVVTAIRKREARVVVAHSLGSVVAYEALWAHPDVRVDLLLTLGSPLGMPDIVFDRLAPAPAGGWGRRPPNVASWANIADPGDLIAIPRRLATRFRDLAADIETQVHMFDFHRVANYLRNNETRMQLAQAVV